MTLTDIVDELSRRVSDFPGPTCPNINSAIRDCVSIQKAFAHIAKHSEDAKLTEMAEIGEIDAANIEYLLEELRKANEQLRDSLHEALNSRKIASSALQELIE